MGVADVSENGFALGWDGSRYPIRCSQATRCIRNPKFWRSANPNPSRNGASSRCAHVAFKQEGKIVIDYVRSVMVWKKAHGTPPRHLTRKFKGVATDFLPRCYGGGGSPHLCGRRRGRDARYVCTNRATTPPRGWTACALLRWEDFALRPHATKIPPTWAPRSVKLERPRQRRRHPRLGHGGERAFLRYRLDRAQQKKASPSM
jgi:hypothetical protein